MKLPKFTKDEVTAVAGALSLAAGAGTLSAVGSRVGHWPSLLIAAATLTCLALIMWPVVALYNWGLRQRAQAGLDRWRIRQAADAMAEARVEKWLRDRRDQSAPSDQALIDRLLDDLREGVR